MSDEYPQSNSIHIPARENEYGKVRTLDALQETLGSVVDDLGETDDAVLIERRGVPRAAIISIEDDREFRDLQEPKRRQQAFAEFERLRLEIADALSDLSEDERQQLAEEFAVEFDGRTAARFPFAGTH